MEIIKSISEAYSVNPVLIKINQNGCKEIKLETIEVGKRYGHPVEELFYIGYNDKGEKIFQYLYNSVNVHYAQ